MDIDFSSPGIHGLACKKLWSSCWIVIFPFSDCIDEFINHVEPLQNSPKYVALPDFYDSHLIRVTVCNLISLHNHFAYTSHLLKVIQSFGKTIMWCRNWIARHLYRYLKLGRHDYVSTYHDSQLWWIKFPKGIVKTTFMERGAQEYLANQRLVVM